MTKKNFAKKKNNDKKKIQPKKKFKQKIIIRVCRILQLVC